MNLLSIARASKTKIAVKEAPFIKNNIKLVLTNPRSKKKSKQKIAPNEAKPIRRYLARETKYR